MLVLGHVTYHDFAFFRLPLPNQPGCWWLCLDGDGVGPGVPELLPFPVPLAVIPFELLLCGESVPASLLLSPLAEESTTPLLANSRRRPLRLRLRESVDETWREIGNDCRLQDSP